MAWRINVESVRNLVEAAGRTRSGSFIYRSIWYFRVPAAAVTSNWIRPTR